jgi:DNA-binding LytR/AlgR family response regulator
MNIAICDDAQAFCENLDQMLMSCKYSGDITLVREFERGEDLIDCYSASGAFDLLFLDIEMPGLSGLDVGQHIRKIDKDVLIVFVTAFDQYVFQSFPIEPFDYLLKPLNKKSLERTLKRALSKYRDQHQIVEVKSQGQIHLLKVKDLVYIEFCQRHLVFYTKDLKHESVGKLDEYEKTLTPYGFLRCHKGFLINMAYVQCVGRVEITTTVGTVVPMSARKKQACLGQFSEYLTRYRI